MKPAPFDYIRPKTLAEAIAALGRKDLSTAVIAGGQSMLPLLSLRATSVDLLVDVGRLEELKAVTETPTNIHIGAAITHAAIEDGRVPDIFGGLMRRVAGQIAYRAIRNHGTIGGSVALADPAADWPGCLMALDARACIAGPKEMRSEPVTDFIRGIYSTSLAADEIIIGFDIPRPDAAPRWGFSKVARKSGAFADSIAFVTARGQGGPISVVLGGTASRAHPLPAVAECLRASTTPSENIVKSAIARDLADVEPETDAYQLRIHTATILNAIRELRSQ